MGDPGQGAPGRRRLATSAPCQRVYLHIGEPKTGTTFIQDALWANRSRLGLQGIQLPGYTDRDHSRASRDLREAQRQPGDPVDPWTGEWDVLAGQALRVPGRALISNELLAASSPQQAERAVRSLRAADLHILVTLRDFASLLPAEWQEAVKCRGTTSWQDWLSDVMAAEPAPERRRRSWFWRVHDTLAILRMWTELIPPDRVHIITVPRPKVPELLWGRFAAAAGFDPASCDLIGARDNSSLGAAETEFLRRMNQVLPADVPDWFYARELKRVLARGVLTTRQQSSRPVLTAGQQAWAAEQAELLISSLRAAHFDVVGDLAELRPPGGITERQTASGDADAATSRAIASAEQQLDAAVLVSATLGVRCYQALYPAPRRRPRFRGVRQLAAELKWRTLNGRRIRRLLRRGSRRPAVRRLRVLIWSVLMRPGHCAGRAAGGGRAQPAAGGRPGQLPESLPAARIRLPGPRSAPEQSAAGSDTGKPGQASAGRGRQRQA